MNWTHDGDIVQWAATSIVPVDGIPMVWKVDIGADGLFSLSLSDCVFGPVPLPLGELGTETFETLVTAKRRAETLDAEMFQSCTTADTRQGNSEGI